MNGFTFDIQGKLNSINLSDSKALWPLFEAVVNSIQSIDDSDNCGKGQIEISAHREAESQQTMDDTEHLERIVSFSVTDNGSGFNSQNYESFQTAYSTYKIRKGCKGIGRFLWLKAFESVDVESIFVDGDKHYKRKFTFSPSGVAPEENLTETDIAENKTKVILNGFKHPYRDKAPVELAVIAKQIIEHCLPFFISGNCPRIVIKDGISDSVDLNDYFDKNIKDTLCQDHFQIKDAEFTLYHLHLPEGTSKHEIHFCANMQEVKSVELSRYVPDLQKKIVPVDNPTGFYYVGYLSSPYLDSIVNTTRTNFEYDETGDQISLEGTGKDSILSASVEYIKAYLSDYISEIKKHKRETIDTFVAERHPTYRYLLGMRPDVYDRIPAGLTLEKLELALHKEVQAWETDIKLQGKELEKAAKDELSEQDIAYEELFEKYWAGVTELSKTCLAEYVTRRKTLLTMLEDALTIQDSGRFKKEEVIHSLICPMQHTSNDVSFEEMNLWIVDERLAYHRFLASDKTLKSMPVVDSSSTKEPDIAVFDQAFAYSDSEEPFSTVTIVEFKKPDNDSKNPVNQVGEYVDLIRAGKKKKVGGQSFVVTDTTLFRCYVICDLTDKMRTHCVNSSLMPTPDNMGYSGFNQTRRSYTEVISYNKLLTDAKKRNQILMDKLFSPKPQEVIYAPELKEAE